MSIRKRTLFAAILVMVSAAVPQGCAPSASNPNGRNGAAGVDPNGAMWPFWPAKMRVHPLTRVVAEPQTGRQVIEARLEFTDADGVTTRACGQLTLRVYPDSLASDGSEPQGTWNQDLRDLAVNRRQYDDVTDTYLFRLDLDPAKMTEKMEVRAFFISATGLEMSARLAVKKK